MSFDSKGRLQNASKSKMLSEKFNMMRAHLDFEQFFHSFWYLY